MPEAIVEFLLDYNLVAFENRNSTCRMWPKLNKFGLKVDYRIARILLGSSFMQI